MKGIILITLLIYSSLTFASAEEDKKVGTCAMYLYIADLGKFASYRYTADDALALADKQSRAVQYGKIYANEFKDYQIKKKNTSPLIQQGISSCYDIGLKLTK